MVLLRRSRSTIGKTQGSKTKDDSVVEPMNSVPNDLKKSMSSGRPKTSEGRCSSSFSRPRPASRAIDRSVELQIPGQTIEVKAGEDTFSFPTPSPRLPPRSATYQAPSSSPFNAHGAPGIGVALGSPSQVAPPAWGRSFTADHISNRIPTHSPLAVSEKNPFEDQRPPLRKKKSGWKTLGSFLGRRTAKPAVDEPFYKLRLPQEQSANAPPTDDSSSLNTVSLPAQSTSSPAHRRTPSITRGMARFEARAQADLASFQRDPQAGNMRSPTVVQKQGFSPMFRALNETRDSEDMFRVAQEGRTDSPLSVNEKGTGSQPRTPRLDLDLPNLAFERYSVLFETVLEGRKPSLLERRQSKLQKKRPVKAVDPVTRISEEKDVSTPGIQAKPQRSITLPHLSKALTIKVEKASPSAVNGAAGERDTSGHRPRTVQRSKTAPPRATSPVVQTVPNPRVVVGRSPTSLTSENSLPPTPMTTNTMSDHESIAIINNDLSYAQRNVDHPEPSFDMMTSKPARVQTERIPNPYVRVKSPEDLERQLVQVSVARQVSVSKARKQVQKAAAIQQPLRPRVVELGKDRKSTVGLIEGGDD